MATETEQLVVSLEARVRDFERNFQRANKAANDNFGKIENRARQSAKRLDQTMANAATGVSNRLKGLAGSLAAAFTGRELLALTDSYTRFTNQLKVAGLEGATLAETQNQLFGIAQKYGVQLEAVATLYGRNAASAKEMNLTQEDQLRVVEATAAALKTSGQTSEQAAGALLQLSQALGGTKIQAEEYNSLIDGARPLLQAVAAGSDRWGGSVAKLTADVKAGNVATRDFVQALLNGANGAIEQAGKATLTTSAAFETLRNALVKYFGEADQSQGATAALAIAIKALADNLDMVVPAVAALSTALGIGLVTNAARAAIAARGAGGALLAAFGGTVGLAITGITVALVGLASETAKTQAALDGVEAITSEAARTLNQARGKADSAATGVKGVGAEAATSEVKVRAFAGAVGEAAQKLYELAKARQTALISDLEARRQQASLQYSELWKGTSRGLDARVEGDGSLRHKVFSADGWIADFTRLGRTLGVLSDPEADLQTGMTNLKKAMGDYDAAIREARGNLARFATQPSATAAPAKTGTGSKARTGQSEAEKAAEAEKRLQERVRETTEDLRLQLQVADLRAKGLDVQADKEQAIAQLHRQFPELVNTQNASLKEQLALMEGLALAAVDRAEAQRLAQEQKDRQDAYAGVVGEGNNFIRDQQAELQSLGMGAQEAAAFRHEQELLNQAQQAGITLTDAQRAEIAELAMGMASAEAATTAFAESQRNAAELSQFFKESALDALHGIITGTKSAAQSVAELGSALVKMALQAALMNTGPLASLFNGESLGSALGGIGKALGFAEGGHIRGPGTGTSDSIPVMASNGEFIVNAKATERNLPLLHAINKGKVPAFATGGRVGNLASTYAPSVSVSVSGRSAEPAQLARMIADEVGKHVSRPDGFRRTEGQSFASIASKLARANARNN